MVSPGCGTGRCHGLFAYEMLREQTDELAEAQAPETEEEAEAGGNLGWQMSDKDTPPRFKRFICNRCLWDTQLYKLKNEELIFTGIYRYAEFVVAEDAVPSPDDKGNYIDIDIGDDAELSEFWLENWEAKIHNPTLKKKVDKIIASEDPLDGIEELGFENSGGSYEIKPESGTLKIIDES